MWYNISEEFSRPFRPGPNGKAEIMSMNPTQIHPQYPTAGEISAWIDRLWQLADERPCQGDGFGDCGARGNLFPWHMRRSALVRFTMPGMRPFYGMWTPALKGPAPLIVHTPGYGAELSFHPDVVGEGFNVLELSPLGYWTPEGFDDTLRWDGQPQMPWPVLPNSVTDACSDEGYFGWLLNVIGAVKWAMSRPTVIPDRVSFFGTSQGGGGSLLLGSVFRDHGTRCVCADEPFLTNYPLANNRGAYAIVPWGMEKVDPDTGWRNLGFVDTLAHADRMTYPVLLTCGTNDGVCPPETVKSLFEALDTDKMLLSMKDRDHGYQYEFVRHALTWFSLYA